MINTYSSIYWVTSKNFTCIISFNPPINLVNAISINPILKTMRPKTEEVMESAPGHSVSHFGGMIQIQPGWFTHDVLLLLTITHSIQEAVAKVESVGATKDSCLLASEIPKSLYAQTRMEVLRSAGAQGNGDTILQQLPEPDRGLPRVLTSELFLMLGEGEEILGFSTDCSCSLYAESDEQLPRLKQ